MTDRPSRRWSAPLVAVLVTASLLTAACSKPVAGTPVAGAAGGGDDAAETTAAPSESDEPTGDASVDGDLGPLVGTWAGEYTCLQGETGLTLAIEPIDEASVKVVFEFFPVSENPSAQQGSYEMIGAYDGDRLLFKQNKWIERPSDYVMVDLEVTSPVEPNVDALSGNVLSEGCKGFSVRRD
ncbi:hypothetical protein [Actinophytocola sp.]|uniref:hypothetical protein n=1 Tax=Actinophytocola sp. TaxID=1872138 RepID=UPI003D6C43A2